MFRPEKVLNYQVLFLPLKLKGLAIAQPLRNKRNSEFFSFWFLGLFWFCMFSWRMIKSGEILFTF